MAPCSGRVYTWVLVLRMFNVILSHPRRVFSSCRGGWKKKRGWGDTCIKINDKWCYWRQHGWAWGISNGICLFCIHVFSWHPVELLSTWLVFLSQQQRGGLCSVSLVRSATALGILQWVAGLTPSCCALHLRSGTDVAAARVKGASPVLLWRLVSHHRTRSW